MDVISRSSPGPEDSADELPFLLDENIAQILKHLSFSETVRIRHVSKRFRDYTVRTLLQGYEQAYEKIQKNIILVENELKEIQAKLERGRHPEHCGEYIKKNKQTSSLRIIYGLFKLIRAVVHRYIQVGVWNFISSYSGELLDTFDSALQIACDPQTSQNKFVPDDFFSASGRFLDHFLSEVEPKLIPLLPSPFPFGLQIIDIFDAAQFTNFTAAFKKQQHHSFYSYEGSYQLRELMVVDYPNIDSPDDSNEKKLDAIRRSVIISVRSLNYLYPSRQHSSLVEAYSVNGVAGIFSNIDRNLHYHTGPYEEKDSCDSHHLCKHWIRQNNYRFNSDRFYRSRSRLRQSLRLQMDAVLTCGIEYGVPLDVQSVFNSEFKDESRNDIVVPEQSTTEHDPVYSFQCTLDIHHMCPHEYLIIRRKLNITSEQSDHYIIVTDPMGILG